VTAATCADARLALAAAPRPALAIVDRQLPDGDGLEILRAALAAGTPVIMVTGYGAAATRRLTLEEGAAGFLAKPFSTHDLLDLVRTIVGEASGPSSGPPAPPPTAGPPRPGIH
jgi:DNA-binding response OmpR family regulator